MTDQQKALEEALDHPENPIDEYVLIFHPECGGIITGIGEFRCDECGLQFSVEELRDVLSLPSASLQVTCTKERLIFNAAACRILRQVKLVIFLLDEDNGRRELDEGEKAIQTLIR